MSQITAGLVAGVNVVSLLALNYQARIVAWFGGATTSGDFYFYGSVDSTTTLETQNLQPLGTVTVTAGQNEPQMIELNALSCFPYLVVVAPDAADLYVSGGAAAGTPTLASVATPAADAFTTVVDLTAFDPNFPVTVMASKAETSTDGFLVYGTQDAAAADADGCVLLGTITGGSGSGGTADLAYLAVKGWPYLLFYRRSDSPYTGTTAGTIKAAGVLPGSGIGIPVDVNPTANTIAERDSGGRLEATNFNAGAGAAASLTGATGATVTATTNNAAVIASAGNANLLGQVDANVEATTGAASVTGGTGATITATTGAATMQANAGAATVRGATTATVAALGGALSCTGDTDATITATNGDLTASAPLGTVNLTAGVVSVQAAALGGISLACAAGVGADITLTPSTGAAVALPPNGAGAGNTTELRLRELAANGVNYTGFKSPDALAGNVVYTLPTADGAASAVGGGSALLTDGAGTLSWKQIQSGTSSIGGAGVSAAIAANITANSRIMLTVKDFVASTAVGLEAKAADRTVGTAGAGGQFIVTAYDAGGAAVAGANGTTFDWIIFG